MLQAAPTRIANLDVVPFLHPMGCRGYLIGDPASKEAAVIDAHLDLVKDNAAELGKHGYRMRWVIDTHTHADHPSGSGPLAASSGAQRVAHREAKHTGVTHLPDDGEPLALGDQKLTIRHTPGHTPDHLVVQTDGAVFSGDSLFIGAVARTDFLGGDAGQLYDSLHDVILAMGDDTLVYPGHDYQGRVSSTIGQERGNNPWLQIDDRDRFVQSLTANKPDEPSNMAALLRLNREGVDIEPAISAEETVALVRAGGATTVIDVREPQEVEWAHIPGSRHIPMGQVLFRLDEVMQTPAPRLILCKAGIRAENVRRALEAVGIEGARTIVGGIMSYMQAGGATEGGSLGEAPSSGGCCAAPPPDA